MAKKSKSEPVEIIVVIDRSGSMESIKKDAIGGFNQFLADQKKEDGAANLTVILFDHEYLVPQDSVPIKEGKSLTPETYVPRGSTAMNDAIGRALAALDAKAPKRAVVCILTDGMENASREVTAEQLKARIKSCEAKGWRFVYLAANQDAFASGAALGISAQFTRGFTADSKGMQTAYANLSASTSSYRNS